MIDRKKIEEAATEHANKLDNSVSPVVRMASFEAFKAGINWFLDNLWHDASKEIPKEKRSSFIKLGNEYFSAYRMEDYYYVTDINNTCEVALKIYEVTRWLYIDDLKGGSNG